MSTCPTLQHEQDTPWHEATCAQAACWGHINCLKWARQNGCTWDESTCSLAALQGNLDCLSYAHENGCPWNSWTPVHAVLGGSIDCLQYLYEQQCPWDAWTSRTAAANNQPDCLMWAYHHGCPWDPEHCPQLLVHELVNDAISRVIATEIIQREWLAAYYNPERLMCRRRIWRQWGLCMQYHVMVLLLLASPMNKSITFHFKLLLVELGLFSESCLSTSCLS